MRIRTVIILVITAFLLPFAISAQDQPIAPQILDVPQPAPRIAAGSWSGVLKEHPRLFGPRTHLQILAKAKPEIYKEIKANKSLQAVGITRAVEDVGRPAIEPFIQAAMKRVAAGVTDVHQDTWIALANVAETYDLLFDAIAPQDRAKMIEWMNGHLGKYRTDENAFHNSTLTKILCYLRIAYATWGENPRAKEFRDYALVKLYEGKIVPVLKEFGVGGGFTECGWYSRGSLWHLVQALELARRIEGYDGFQKALPFFYQRLAYEMYQPYPGLWTYGAERFAVEGDGSNTYGGHNEYPHHLRTVLAQYFRGSELSRYVANKRRKGSNFEARLVSFLYEEEPDSPLDLATFPLAHLASAIGRVYARSDWTDDATWFRFECGDYWNGHQHFEVGNFEIFRREPLATESGEYHDYLSNHSVNWLLRTIAHNCILVYQPDEKWGRMRDGERNKYANDGGQTKKWEWPVDSLDIWKSRREQFERGEIVAYQNRPEYTYVAGDCTKAYVPSKLASWIRQIVFVRPYTFVIFDRVVSTRPEYEKTWLLHSRNEPEIKDLTAIIANGKGRLIVQTLLPEKPVIRKIEGYTYRDQTFDPPKTNLTPLANRWRIEVLPPAAQVEDIFLHVLTTDEPKPASVVRKGNQIGARVGEVEVLFDGKVGGMLALSGKQIPLKAEVEKSKYE
jgi:hypothetical protein